MVSLYIQFLVFFNDFMSLRTPRPLRSLRPPGSLRSDGLQKLSFFYCNHLILEHFVFFEVKQTILINEAGEVTMALEANEVIESLKIGFDTSIQYINDKQ